MILKEFKFKSLSSTPRLGQCPVLATPFDTETVCPILASYLMVCPLHPFSELGKEERLKKGGRCGLESLTLFSTTFLSSSLPPFPIQEIERGKAVEACGWMKIDTTHQFAS